MTRPRVVKTVEGLPPHVLEQLGREARQAVQREFTLASLLREIVACTHNPHDPKRWYIKLGEGKRFSAAIRAARDVLGLEEPG